MKKKLNWLFGVYMERKDLDLSVGPITKVYNLYYFYTILQI